MKQKYDLEERLLKFSLRILKIVEEMPATTASTDEEL